MLLPNLMNKLLLILLLFACPLRGSAQEDSLRQVVSTVFYNTEVFDKIFFEYRGDSITFMEGYPKGMKAAFVIPDINVQQRIPDLLDRVGTGHARERYFMTATFLLHPTGNIYITANVMDMAIPIFVHFDEILIKNRDARIQFHTTSFPESPGTKYNHYAIDCSLKRKRKRWKVKDLKIKPIECCTSLWPSSEKR